MPASESLDDAHTYIVCIESLTECEWRKEKRIQRNVRSEEIFPTSSSWPTITDNNGGCEMERVGVTADVMTHLNVLARTEFIPKDVCNEIEFVHSLSFSPCNYVSILLLVEQ